MNRIPDSWPAHGEAEVAAPPVVLAHEAPFALPPLHVEPALRRVVRDDGADTIVEPLVMQVLVALARAHGDILTRDELVDRCWGGRIVGDDSIARVIALLRKLGAEFGQGAFTIETITKVGYRLLAAGAAAASTPVSATEPIAIAPAPSWSRKPWPQFAAAAALVATTGAAAAAWSYFGQRGTNADITIGVEPVANTSNSREARAFAGALTSDLADLAGAISRVSFLDEPDGGAGRLDYIVRIAVDRERDRLVARVRLVQGGDAAVLWSGRFEESADHPDRLRKLVAMQAAGVMRCGLERSAKALGDATTTRLFFAACAAIKDGDFARGQSFARQVVERRPDVAAGWSCLALTTIGSARGPEVTPQRLAAVQAEARGYALRALKLDPRSGRAYQALAAAERGGSAAQFSILERGIFADPELYSLHRDLASALFNAGYVRASVAPAQRALALDPTEAYSYSNLLRRLLAVGRISEAMAMQVKAEQLWPGEVQTVSHRLILLTYEPNARQALATFDRLAPSLPQILPALPLARIELRLRADPGSVSLAEIDRAAEAEFATEPTAAWRIAAVMTRIGQAERAFAWLARAPRSNAQWQWSLLFWPDVSPLRRDPRFYAAMAELGLVDLWRKRGQWPDFCSEPGLTYDCRREAARIRPVTT